MGINDAKGRYADDLKRRKIMTKRTTDQIQKTKAADSEKTIEMNATGRAQTARTGMSRTNANTTLNLPFVEGSLIDIMLFQGGVKRNGFAGSSVGNALGHIAT